MVKRNPVSVSDYIPVERLAVVLVFAAVALLAFSRIGDPDFFWHLANGKEMVRQGRIINEEIFSYTKQGTEFSNHAWLAQIVFYLIFEAAGPFGIVAFKTLLVILIAFSIFRTARANGVSPIFAGMLTAAVAFVSLTRYRARPEIFSLLLFSLLVLLLTGYLAGRRNRIVLYVIPAVLLVWDVLHGAVYGVVYLLVLTIGETAKYILASFFHAPSEPAGDPSRDRAKTLWAVTSISLLCLLISPYGLRSYEFFTEFVTSNPLVSTIVELSSPDLLTFLDFWILLAVTGILSLVFYRSADATKILTMIPFAILSVRYLRVRPFFALAAVPALASYAHLIADAEKTVSSRKWTKWVARLPYVLVAAFVLFTVNVKFLKKNNPLSFGYEINERFIPTGATEFIFRSGLKGNMFNPGHFGGCLAYFLYPERKIFMYNHHMVFGDLPIILSNPDFVERYGIEYAVLDRNTRGDPVTHLFTTGRWALLYFDDLSLVVAKRNGVNEPAIQQYGLM